MTKNSGAATSLCAHLDAAQAAGARGNAAARSNSLDAFRKEVAAQTGKGLTQEQAATLLKQAENL